MSRLFEFAFTDRSYRLKAYLCSGAIALVCALIARLLLHWDEKDVLLVTAIVLYSLVALFVLYYVFARKASALAAAIPSLRRTAFTIAFVLAGFLSISLQTRIVSTLQASIVDLRLSNVDKTTRHAFAIQSPEQADIELRKRFQKFQSIADISYRYQVPIDPHSLGRAEVTIRTSLKRPALSPQTKQAGLIASAKFVDLAALSSTGPNTMAPPSYVINSNLEFSDQNVRLKGDHAVITFGDGELDVVHSTVVFDGIDFRSERAFRQAHFLQDSNSTVIVRNGTVENLDQTLDHVILVNVQFRHSMIKLNGGPITLINVSFIDCDLRWLMLGPIGFELKEKITKANGQPITFAFEGHPEHTQTPE